MITTAKRLFGAWIGLFVLGAANFLFAFVDLGPWDAAVTMFLAVIMAGVITLFFMGLAAERFTVRIAFGLVFVFFTLLIGLMWADVGTRSVPPLIPPAIFQNG